MRCGSDHQTPWHRSHKDGVSPNGSHHIAACGLTVVRACRLVQNGANAEAAPVETTDAAPMDVEDAATGEEGDAAKEDLAAEPAVAAEAEAKAEAPAAAEAVAEAEPAADPTEAETNGDGDGGTADATGDASEGQPPSEFYLQRQLEWIASQLPPQASDEQVHTTELGAVHACGSFVSNPMGTHG